MAKAVAAPNAGILNEFANADLGDARRTKRLRQIVPRLDAAPAKTFPRAMGTDAELEGFYRFIRNEAVTHVQLLAPHQQATVARLGALQEALVVHDGTEMKYGGSREGLGTLNKSGSGFHSHVSLAVTADGERNALGALAVESWVRTGPTLRHPLK